MRTIYMEAGFTNTEVQPCAFLDDAVFVTKSGETGIVIQVTPRDSECLEADELAAVAQQFEGATRLFGRAFRVYQYLLKRRAPAIHHTGAHAATWDRAEYLSAKELYSIDHYLVLLHGEGFGRGAWWPGKTMVDTAQAALQQSARVVRSQADALVLHLRDVLPMKVAGKQAAYSFLRRLLNYDPAVSDSVRLKYDTYVDYFAADSAIEGHRGFLRVGDRYVRVLTLKDSPSTTAPDFLRVIRDLPAECIVCTEWRGIDSHDARQLVTKKVGHFHRSKYVVNIMATVLAAFSSNHNQERPENMQQDESASAMESELGALSADLESSGAQLGEFALTVIVHDDDQQRLKRATGEAFKAFAAKDAVLYEEKQNVLSAWLAVVPGGHRNQFRSLYLTSRNYADLSLLFSPAFGDPSNAHLRSEYLVALETRQQTPYFLNLHYQDVPHTLISGMTGSGKSFTCNLLLEHAQKYGPRTVIFDLGGSYRELAVRLAGSYMTLGIERNDFTINPFSLPPTPENLHFLYSFARVLIESGGFVLDSVAAKAVHDTVCNLYELDPAVRRLRTLAACLPIGLHPPLARWVEGGQYATLFDNVEDTLTCSEFQVFDFEGIDRYPDILEPLLFYVLHRSSAALYDRAQDGTFKLFLLDEAWRFFRNPTVKAYVTEALKTWRKRNAAMVLATQSSSDL
ncbi:MAG: type secretion/conjugal transfer ATPase, VirB4 family, partial [Bryobacterales bacterium]|nr:type secretion/conjugal transfer ATPase, VirB4 family [Bryobacterales bacterium]